MCPSLEYKINYYENVIKDSHIINLCRVVSLMKKDYTMKIWP